MNKFKHFKTVCKHRYLVYKYSLKVGIPWQGFIHDLSKFSTIEFNESAKYYQGNMSPIFEARKHNGMYSNISVHHTNKNKHHFEYRIDFFRGDVILSNIPYKYLLEFTIDMISASKTYLGEEFDNSKPYEYFFYRQSFYLMHPFNKEFTLILLRRFKDYGFKGLMKKDTMVIYELLGYKYKNKYKVKFYSINNEYKYEEIIM